MFITGTTLEDMDRIVNCPENVDKASWQQMCKLRRDKIQLEENVRNLGKLLILDTRVKLMRNNVEMDINFSYKLSASIKHTFKQILVYPGC